MCMRDRRVLIFAVFVVATLAMMVLPARAEEKGPPSQVMAVLQTDLHGFNTNNFALSNSQYASDVVIIDEFPPYRWEGPGANARYWADFRKLSKAIKLTCYHLSYQKPSYWEIADGRAYIVAPAVFTGVADGKPFTEMGVETLLLVKVDGAWKMQGWAYGKTSMH